MRIEEREARGRRSAANSLDSKAGLVVVSSRYCNGIGVDRPQRSEDARRESLLSWIRLYGSSVIPVQSTPQGTKSQHFKPSSSFTAFGFKRISALKNNCSSFFASVSRENVFLVGADSRYCNGNDFRSKVVTELPDLLPRRRHVAGEVLPESGKSGQPAVSVKAEGKHPSEKPLLTLTLTEEQLRDLAFAVYCQTVEIQDSDEADHPEVLPVIRRLNEVSAMCIALEKAASGSVGRQRSGRTDGTDGALS